MIKIKPSRCLNCGYKLSKVTIDKEVISQQADVIELRIKDVRVKMDIEKDGCIRIWSDDGKFINDGYKNIMSTDFKFAENKKEKINE